MNCLVCNTPALEEVPGFGDLPRVTSDCKPFPPGGRLFVCGRCGALQKAPDERWLAEIASIYSGYEIYGVAGGAEQLIFAADGAAPRSKRLIEALLKHAGLPARGRLIDIGCGNGAALANFSAALPGWDLYGAELSDRAAAALRRLPRFRELFTVALERIPGRYDLVSMIHSLEHMPSPATALEAAARLVGEGGRLFVEVPDAETSPFDLPVADHLMHFSAATLAYLAAKCGVRPLLLSNQLLRKELTLIGAREASAAVLPDASHGKAIAERTVRWLRAVIELGRSLAKTSPGFGIFGTSISAMWLYGVLGAEVAYFVDEDPARVGKSCAGKPVLSPAQLPPGATVYVPLVPEIAGAAIARLSRASVRFVAPPAS